jgi:hypothetical protein
VRQASPEDPMASEHIVQFFDSEEKRDETVAEFLAAGYKIGEPAIVVAKPANWTSTADRLESAGVPVKQAMADGMIVVKDAHDTLRRVSPTGSPDAAAFDALVGKEVAGLARRGVRVRAYGEMVDMLAGRGQLADAIRLEALLNRLGERVPFFLLCGYSAAHFIATATHRALREIAARTRRPSAARTRLRAGC